MIWAHNLSYAPILLTVIIILTVQSGHKFAHVTTA